MNATQTITSRHPRETVHAVTVTLYVSVSDHERYPESRASEWVYDLLAKPLNDPLGSLMQIAIHPPDQEGGQS